MRLELTLAAAILAALPALAQEAPAPDAAAEAVDEAVPSGEADAPASESAEEDAATSQGGTGALVNAEGAQLGNASVSITASGNALVVVNAEGFPEGVFAVHLHQVGLCEGPTFESAGDHITGDRDHGVMVSSGPHTGDLPNVHVGADGVLAMDAVAIGLTTEQLFDEDGGALMVHTAPDDYTSQPGGNSGERQACAVIEPGGDMAQ